MSEPKQKVRSQKKRNILGCYEWFVIIFIYEIILFLLLLLLLVPTVTVVLIQ